MTLLREIQDVAVNADVDLTVVLRKCRISATRLGYPDFKDWVDRELAGYKDKSKLPDYRIIPGAGAFGTFSGPFGSGIKNAPIPSIYLPEGFEDYARKVYLHEGISSYILLLANSNGSSPCIHWPADLVLLVGQELDSNYNLISAWQTLSLGSIANVLDTVRNRILNFVLELESEAPNAGESFQASPVVPPERTAYYFYTYIISDPERLNHLNIGVNSHMADQYNNHGQSGAMGPNAQVQNNSFQQIQQQAATVNAVELVRELDLLLERVETERDNPDKEEDIASLELARKAADRGDTPKALKQLAKVGAWVKEPAIQVGAGLVVELVKKLVGL
jgi:hypothetical protein